RQGAANGGRRLSRPRLGRRQAPSLELLPGGQVTEAGGGGCRFRQPRRHRLPHGQRIIFPAEDGVLGCCIPDHQDLARSPSSMAKKKPSESSRPAKLISVSAESIFSKPVSKKQKAVLSGIAKRQ